MFKVVFSIKRCCFVEFIFKNCLKNFKAIICFLIFLFSTSTKLFLQKLKRKLFPVLIKNTNIKMVTPQVEGQQMEAGEEVYNCEVANKYVMGGESEEEMDPLEYLKMVEERTRMEKAAKKKQKERELKEKKNKLMNPPKKNAKKGL